MNSNPLLNKLFKTNFTKPKTFEPKVYETQPDDEQNQLQVDVEYGEDFEPESFFEENEQDINNPKKRKNREESQDEINDNESNDVRIEGEGEEVDGNHQNGDGEDGEGKFEDKDGNSTGFNPHEEEDL